MKKTLSLLAGAALLLLAIPQANADTYTYTDHWNDWPGFNSGSTHDVDQIGNHPEVEQMVITTNDSGILQTVAVVFASGSNSRTLYDSLFINSYNVTTTNTQWDDWDYFVHAGDQQHSSWTDGNVPSNGIYQVKPNYSYTTVAVDANGGSAGRKYNPNGIDADSLNLIGAFVPSYANDILTYDFTGLINPIDVSDGFFMAYAPWCANDVMGTPEPATMLLFGTGLIGLVGIGRRKMR